MYVILYSLIALVIILCIVPMSSGFFAGLGLILAVIAVIAILKRNHDIKSSMKNYNEDSLIIQNVREGGVIKIANVDGYDTDLDLKVIGRNLYMEGDYSWYELECLRPDGEKVWVDVEDDDELMVSVVLDKLRYAQIKLSNTLENIDEEESGTVKYNNVVFSYQDSGEANFYRHCDDKKVEKFSYWDFKTMEGKYLISIEKWKNEVGREDMTIYYSQNIRPLSSITVYSTHQEG